MMPAAYAVVDTAALRHNLARVRELAPGAKLMAVIKANGYGHGLLRVAGALRDVEAFAVARVQEGMALREAGFGQRIAVLQGFIDLEELDAHAAHGLEPVIHSLHQLYLLERQPLERPLSPWLKLDSGMHRLGVSAEDFAVCLRHLRRCPWVAQPVGLMTHLSNADLLGDPATLEQVARFRSAVAYAAGEKSAGKPIFAAQPPEGDRAGMARSEKSAGKPIFTAGDPAHCPSGQCNSVPGGVVTAQPPEGDRAGMARSETSIANSAAILAWPEAHADWVRPGIMLYGVSPFAERCGEQEGLKPVMTLRSRLISVKWLRKGDRVGYAGDWVCQRDTRLGIAAIGYGDGYPRHAPSGTPVLVRGCRVPLAGRVSMDMISLDLNDCPDAQVGDPVTLWGDGLPVEDIARHAGTIPYTLLCNVTQRVRILEQDAAPAGGA